MKSICVFCGSNLGARPAYRAEAIALGQLLASKGIRQIYGGGHVGLMGVIADAVLEAGGAVTGVIPHFLNQKEVGHKSLTELILVETMHERKQKMAELSDGFIAMPGGMGTMEEMCEILTWGQLGLHRKPFGLLNVEGYYDLLIRFFDSIVTERFMHEANRDLVLTHGQPVQLLKMMEAYQAPEVKQWLAPRFT
jgi:uncharacterized protein (TIGR00730 family)